MWVSINVCGLAGSKYGSHLGNIYGYEYNPYIKRRFHYVIHANSLSAVSLGGIIFLLKFDWKPNEVFDVSRPVVQSK